MQIIPKYAGEGSSRSSRRAWPITRVLGPLQGGSPVPYLSLLIDQPQFQLSHIRARGQGTFRLPNLFLHQIA